MKEHDYNNDKNYINITNKEEVVQEDWLYGYDDSDFVIPVCFYDKVEKHMIGKKAKDASFAWNYFRKPIKKS